MKNRNYLLHGYFLVLNILYIIFEYFEVKYMLIEKYSMIWKFMNYSNWIESLFIFTFVIYLLYIICKKRNDIKILGFSLVLCWVSSFIIVMLFIQQTLYNYIQPLLTITPIYIIGLGIVILIHYYNRFIHEKVEKIV